jgi:diguanylate cyclase (GGDEF)-like protein
MNTLNIIAFIQLITGAIITGISIVLCSRSGKRFLKKQEIKRFLTISLIFGVLYAFLIVLWFKMILPADAFSGAVVLACSCLIASIAALNKGMAKRLQEEIAEHTLNKQKIDELSLYDQLTCLYNRRGFISIAEQHLKRLRRLRKKAVLFYIELNNLHMINDKFGYADGDRVLSNVGTLMTSTFRQADVLARIGDNEFMAFLIDAHVEDMETINKNFQKNVRRYNEQRSSRFKLSLSFGISSCDPEAVTSANETISKASVSVKRKKPGRDTGKIPDSNNHSCDFTLIVSNMCSRSFPVDITIHIDGELFVDDIFETGIQNTWKPFHFNLTRGSHTIQAKSSKGNASLIEEFKIKSEHWASIEYHTDDQGARPLSGILSFHMHDVPLKHGFVRPIKK